MVRVLERLPRTPESQQTDEPIDPNRPNNLWQPVAGDHGAHGIFDDRSYSFSPQAWANMNRGWLAFAGIAAGVVFGAALSMRARSKKWIESGQISRL